MKHRVRAIVFVPVLAACSAGATSAQQATTARAAHAPLSLAADDRMIVIPAGRFIAGSTPEERAAAYEDHFTTSGHDDARAHQWFDREADRHVMTLSAFRIDLMPVTQAQFAEFTAEADIQIHVQAHVAAPSIDQAGWQAQGFAQDFATQVARFVWLDGRPPGGREDHPVVLVAWADADRYCAWRGALRGGARRLPTADEFEKAARGDGGMAYPWGNTFEPEKLNSAVHGPGDTTPVGAYTAGASPYGVLDMAGNVFQWTATPGEGGEAIVKGSAWTEFAGVGRGASLATFAKTTRHVAIGFRCAADAE